MNGAKRILKTKYDIVRIVIGLKFERKYNDIHPPQYQTLFSTISLMQKSKRGAFTFQHAF